MFVMCCMAHFSRKAISVRPELLVFFCKFFSTTKTLIQKKQKITYIAISLFSVKQHSCSYVMHFMWIVSCWVQYSWIGVGCSESTCEVSKDQSSKPKWNLVRAVGSVYLWRLPTKTTMKQLIWLTNCQPVSSDIPWSHILLPGLMVVLLTSCSQREKSPL